MGDFQKINNSHQGGYVTKRNRTAALIDLARPVLATGNNDQHIHLYEKQWDYLAHNRLNVKEIIKIITQNQAIILFVPAILCEKPGAALDI